MTISTRPVQPGDRPSWQPLWDGYLAFYRHELPPAVTEATWRRLLDPDEPVHGIVAVSAGDLIGICHLVTHRSTWSPTSYCYLEDLYVDVARRQVGAGRTLIRAAVDHAVETGSDKLYWHTQVDNSTARRLYDKVACRRGFIVYERDLP